MLDKRSKKILWLLGFGLLGVIFLEMIRPQPVNWRESYTASDKIPLGCFVFFEEAPSFFNTIESVTRDPFEFLSSENLEENSTYFFVNPEVFFDKRQSEKLLDYVSEGNTVFISSRNIAGDFIDSLKVKGFVNYKIREEKIYPEFCNSSLKSDSLFGFDQAVYKAWFSEIDTLKTTALGYYNDKNSTTKSLNYISVEFGKGTVLLHTLPEAFTNYYLLRNNEQYAANVISYIDSETVYWDEYLKSGKQVVTSPMRFVLSQEALIWAYYLLLLGLLIFVLFQGKRRQRTIPVIKPLRNSSVEFTQTIGNLYFQHSDYSNIIAKKITYFLERIRSRFYLDTQNLSEDFIKQLSVKSGNSEEKTRNLIHYIKHLKGKPTHNEQDLMKLNKITDEFRI